MKNLPQASMLGTKMRSAPSHQEPHSRKEGLAQPRGVFRFQNRSSGSFAKNAVWRTAGKQERTCSLNLFSCLPHSIPHSLWTPKIYAECNETKVSWAEAAGEKKCGRENPREKTPIIARWLLL